MAAASSECGRDKKYIHMLIGKPTAKTLLGIPRSRSQDNIKMRVKYSV
jgi:hypothetical protein